MSDSADEDLFRREAVGAFAHELRTPLTSIHMVLELARMQSADDELCLKGDLPDLLKASVAGLELLAREIQDMSRLERGLVTLQAIPCTLAELLAEAAATAAADATLTVEQGEPISGTWDHRRLVDSLASLIRSTNQAGDGSGEVRARMGVRDDRALLSFESGTPGREPRPITSDLGFGFFAARALIIAQGGTVTCERSEGFLQITLSLPL